MTARWSDPGSVRIADGIHRVPLQMPSDGLRAINVYALETDRGLALIDGGWRRPGTYDEFSTALAEFGCRPDDVHDVFVTHVHRDHYTFAVDLRRRHGCRIHLGSAEAPGIVAIGELASNMPTSSLRELERAGADDIARAVRLDTSDGDFDSDDWEPPDAWLTEGALDIPGHRLTAVHTPGHTKGHMVFHDLDRDISYTGDHVLPTITPSIGFELGEWDLPLGHYLQSLEMMLDDRDRTVLPAHGDTGVGLHARVRELLDHHARRLAATRAVVADLTRATGLDVAERLPWTRRDRPFADLGTFDRMVAVCETLAHLDLDVHRGVLRVENQDGVDVFSVA
ncbi:MBL fold metallo-hydrolase [Rhodococcus sp. Leaf258]|uniref:MBL fold metallo-hydrolase n=1 Tax=unclassified Rhodococcus (in: high G+C Gram-positive bacteria) TaxID=192944 RepID=UPI000A40E126